MPTRRDFLKQSVLLGTGLGLAGAGCATWRDPRWFAPAHDGPVKAGRVVLDEAQLAPGSSIDLTGQWRFKPSYLIAPGHAPEAAAADDGYVEVGVPQLLNRVRWWLDDSEDFDRHERERLDKLGFDTERSDDGWYRLEIDAPDLPSGRRLFAEFDGVAMVSRAFLNGQPLGDHKGMFSRFSFDLTPHLRSGRNVLAMYVSMEKIPPSRVDMGAAVTVNLTASKVMTMSKGMYGPLSPDADNRAYDLYGIWQPVRLVARGPAKIEDAWFNPSLDGAEVQVEVRGLGGPSAGTLEVEWTDRKTGESFATAGPMAVELGKKTIGYALHLKDVAPKHWTPTNPNLYRMVVSLKSRSG
ncbi:MAG TPA: hypothetical protein VFL93_00675, partial [Longimicrobiaceae bacterium]|nr:hypothetical protein [Longimicrobiaceae bacterium]